MASAICYISSTHLIPSNLAKVNNPRFPRPKQLQRHLLVSVHGNTNSFHPLASPHQSTMFLKFMDSGNRSLNPVSSYVRGLSTTRFYNHRGNSEGDGQEKESGLDWPILKRWDVPWPWQTVSLTSLACGISFVLTGLIEAAAVPYLGLQIGELSLDEKAELLFVDQAIATGVVLGVLFSLTKSFQPLPDDLYRYELKDPFSLRKGWLLWAGIGLTGAIGAIALIGVSMSFFSGENPQRETDALIRLLPLIGQSGVSTACLVGITGVLAPVLEETVFRGFFLASLTKWVPTPIAIIISASIFALAHLTPGEFPQLFVLGLYLSLNPCVIPLNTQYICHVHAMLGLIYFNTRNCVGTFICPNSQLADTNHNSCFLEFWSNFASHLSSVSRI